jgi:hypothetical protein
MMAASQRVLLEALTWFILFIPHRRWLILLVLSAILMQGPAAMANGHPLTSPPVDALILIEAASIEAMDQAIIIWLQRRCGGRWAGAIAIAMGCMTWLTRT